MLHERRLVEVYSKLATQFGLRDIKFPVGSSQWMDEIDEQILPFQLRELLQESDPMPLDQLAELGIRLLRRKATAQSDQDNIGLLLAQFAVQSSPTILNRARTLSFKELSTALHPILGSQIKEPPPGDLQKIEALKEQLWRCKRFDDPMMASSLEEGRAWKAERRDFSHPWFLVLLTLYNLNARAIFYRLLHVELHELHVLLGELQRRGCTTVDGSPFGLGPMKLSEVGSLCIRWTQPRRRSFASGRAFREVSVLRALLEYEIRRSATDALTGGAGTTKSELELSADEYLPDGKTVHLSASSTTRSFNPQQWILKAAEKLKTVNPSLELEEMHIDLTLAEGKYLFSEDEELAQIAARTVLARCLLNADSEDKFSTYKDRHDMALQEAGALRKLIGAYQSTKGSEFVGQASYLLNRLLQSLSETRPSE
jgi:hypothetical protein